QPAEPEQGARFAKEADGDVNADDERNEPQSQLQAVRRAGRELAVHVDTAAQRRNQDRGQQQRHDPDADGGDLHVHRPRRRRRRTKASTSRMPAAATHEASAAGTMMMAGSSAPACARKAIAVAGKRVAQALLSAKNVIMAGEAAPGSSFSSCSCSMAFSPKGVAALASPSRLAVMLRATEVSAGCPLGTSGNSGRSRGVSHRASAGSTPAFSAMRLMPNQRA